MSEKKNLNPLVHLAALLVEHDKDERARLIEELELRKQAGEHDAGEWRGWRQFVVYFADRYPYSAAFLPVAMLLYLYSFYQIIWG